ncbi:MAG: AGE family epimerase/isomerase [Paludibaculum sp.]
MWKRLKEQYEENLYGSVLPFWLRHSLDREHGGYFTCLDAQGAVYDTRKYIWLNGRQVWTLSRLYNQVEHRPEWLEAARLGAEFLRRHAFDEKGRCYFSLTREGLPSFYQRKPYAGLFVMLGFSEYAKATGDEWYQAKAEELFVKVQEWIADARLLDRPALAGGVAYSNLADIYAICSMAQHGPAGRASRLHCEDPHPLCPGAPSSPGIRRPRSGTALHLPRWPPYLHRQQLRDRLDPVPGAGPVSEPSGREDAAGLH